MSNILVIEDNAGVRDELALLLGFEGFEVDIAENGRLGLEQATAKPPDLIICDLMMPEMDGYQTLEALRATEKTATVPFLLLTARAERVDMRKGMQLGADDYITKPFSADEILAAVRAALAKKARAQRESDARLAELSKRISSTLPHELHTPLTAILGYGEIMSSDAASMEANEIEAMAQQIVASAIRLNRLTENFMLVAQLQLFGGAPHGGSSLRRQGSVASADAVREVVTRRAQEARREADVRVQISGGAAAAADNHFRKIVDELVDNALRYSERGTPIEVEVGPVEDHLRVRITDRGRGMTDEQMQAVAPYTQFERSVFEQQGMGLGLSVGRMLASFYGGGLDCQPTPGGGTTVTLTLPLADTGQSSQHAP